MSIRVGSCHFVKCKHQNDHGKCKLGIDNNDGGVLIVCPEFEFGGYDD